MIVRARTVVPLDYRHLCHLPVKTFLFRIGHAYFGALHVAGDPERFGAEVKHGAPAAAAAGRLWTATRRSIQPASLQPGPWEQLQRDNITAQTASFVTRRGQRASHRPG